jgi:hypothetical protein
MDMRVEAALGLWSTADQAAMPRRLADRLRVTKSASRMWGFFEGGTVEGVLQAAILGALAPIGLGKTDTARLVALSRDTDSRTRGTAVAAAVGIRNKNSLDEAILLAGLFDPSESVLTATLGAIRERYRRGLDTRLPGLLDRLESLFDTSGRDVRAQAVLTVRLLGRRERGDSRARSILKRAETDRSWVVRDSSRRRLSKMELVD